MRIDIPTTPFISTKLHQPSLAEDHVHRTHPLNRLSKNIHRSLTLVSAPAGYGKSTFVSCWLKDCNLPHCWINLDKNDNDLRVFLNYIVTPHLINKD